MAALFVSACGGGGSSRAPVVSGSVAPTTTALPVVPNAADLARTFNAILGSTNTAIYAFADRLKTGVPAASASLPADLVGLANAAAAAWIAAGQTLATQPWPQPLQASVNAVVAAIKIFSADLELLTGLSPSLLPSWQSQFTRDGGALNAADNDVRALLGLPPIPLS
ncbi:MAG: hypothetical protein ACYDH6_07465 [Acidimicrobiales bacterium]